MLTMASELVTTKVTRCGVIPYTISNGKLFFLLAKDRKTSELGDFGGGVKKVECSLAAGLREFYEESRGVFSKTPNEISTSLAIAGNKMAIIFIFVESHWLKNALVEFKSRNSDKKKHNEISEIEWVDANVFINLIRDKVDGKVMWKRIRDFLKNNCDFSFIKLLREEALFNYT